MIGKFLSNTQTPFKLSQRVRAKLYVTDKNGICNGEEFDCFVGVQRTEARVRKVDAVMEGGKFIIGNQFCAQKKFCVADMVLG